MNLMLACDCCEGGTTFPPGTTFVAMNRRRTAVRVKWGFPPWDALLNGEPANRTDGTVPLGRNAITTNIWRYLCQPLLRAQFTLTADTGRWQVAQWGDHVDINGVHQPLFPFFQKGTVLRRTRRNEDGTFSDRGTVVAIRDRARTVPNPPNGGFWTDDWVAHESGDEPWHYREETGGGFMLVRIAKGEMVWRMDRFNNITLWMALEDIDLSEEKVFLTDAAEIAAIDPATDTARWQSVPGPFSYPFAPSIGDLVCVDPQSYEPAPRYLTLTETATFTYEFGAVLETLTAQRIWRWTPEGALTVEYVGEPMPETTTDARFTDIRAQWPARPQFRAGIIGFQQPLGTWEIDGLTASHRTQTEYSVIGSTITIEQTLELSDPNEVTDADTLSALGNRDIESVNWQGGIAQLIWSDGEEYESFLVGPGNYDTIPFSRPSVRQSDPALDPVGYTFSTIGLDACFSQGQNWEMRNCIPCGYRTASGVFVPCPSPNPARTLGRTQRCGQTDCFQLPCGQSNSPTDYRIEHDADPGTLVRFSYGTGAC